MRNQKFEIQNCISELGIYSAVLFDTEVCAQLKIIDQEIIGCLLRTKGSHANEGGVCSGYSVIDTPALISDADYLEGKPVFSLIQSDF